MVQGSPKYLVGRPVNPAAGFPVHLPNEKQLMPTLEELDEPIM
jgi:hypothetical protein